MSPTNPKATKITQNNSGTSTARAEAVFHNGQKDARMNPFYVFLVLKKYSSAKHPLSISDIIEKISINFYQSNTVAEEEVPVKLNTSTVARILDAFLADSNFAFPSDSQDTQYRDPANLGYSLYCVAKQGNTYVPYDSIEEKNTISANEETSDEKKSHKPPRKTKYYYVESVFSDAELKTLIDSMEIYNYFTANDIASITGKLLQISPQSSLKQKSRSSLDQRVKAKDSFVLNNIEDFQRLIKEQKLAEIVAYNYGYDGKKALELIPRSYYPKIIRPISMMWSNGNYYLLAMLGPAPNYTPTNLRLDRIQICREIEATPEQLANYKLPNDFSPSIYRLEHPVMFGGKIEPIHMLCRQTEYNGMMNAIMDTFGSQAICRPATMQELKQYLDYGQSYQPKEPKKEGLWLHVHVSSTTGGVELFATQYCRNCRVISPQSVVDRVKRNLEVGNIFYK